MSPGPHDQRHRGAFARCQPCEIGQARAHVRVIPAANNTDRHVRELIVKTFRIQAGLFPVIIKLTVLPLLKKVLLVFRRMTQWRVPRIPRHLQEPLLDIFTAQGLQALRIAGQVGAQQGMFVCPGRLF